MAVEAGLVSMTTADDEGALLEAVMGLVRALLQGSPHAVAVTRALFGQLDEMSFDDGLTHAAVVSEAMFTSQSAAEGMAAFLEKRPASWAVVPPPQA